MNPLPLLVGVVLVASILMNIFLIIDLDKKGAVLRWVDEREVKTKPIMEEIQQFRALGAVPHVGSIDGVWTARFGPNGPKQFVPSDTGLKQIALAMNILQERENLMQYWRDGIVRSYGQLRNWELTHPVPEVGSPYNEPIRNTLRIKEKRDREDLQPVADRSTRAPDDHDGRQSRLALPHGGR